MSSEVTLAPTDRSEPVDRSSLLIGRVPRLIRRVVEDLLPHPLGECRRGMVVDADGRRLDFVAKQPDIEQFTDLLELPVLLQHLHGELQLGVDQVRRKILFTQLLVPARKVRNLCRTVVTVERVI